MRLGNLRLGNLRLDNLRLDNLRLGNSALETLEQRRPWRDLGYGKERLRLACGDSRG